ATNPVLTGSRDVKTIGIIVVRAFAVSVVAVPFGATITVTGRWMRSVGCQVRKPLVLIVRPSVFDQYVSTIDEAQFVQAPLKCDGVVASCSSQPEIKITDHRHRRLLRARCER